MVKTYIIKGHWMDRGYVNEYRRMFIQIINGRIIDQDPLAYPEDEVYCRQYGGDAPIITNGLWEFLPDVGELERVGLLPTQMMAA